MGQLCTATLRRKLEALDRTAGSDAVAALRAEAEATLEPITDEPRVLSRLEFPIHRLECLRWGRCTLTPPDPQLKGAWYPGGFNPCAYRVKTRFQNVPVKCNLRRYTPGRRHQPRQSRGPSLRRRRPAG
jgi:hypothetical protein